MKSASHYNLPPDEIQRDGGFGENEQSRLSPTSFPELLIDIKNAFGVNKTKREVACAICNIVLARLNARLGSNHLDICAIFGLIEGYGILKLKGAAGFQPRGMLTWEKIKLGEGIIGQTARDKRPIITNDLQNDPRANTKTEQNLAQLSEKIALLAHPLILVSGEMVGVLVLGKFHHGFLSGSFFREPSFIETIEWLAMQIATTYDNANWVNKAKLLRKYNENERRIANIFKQSYSDAINERDLRKLMETIGVECLDILNSGNSAQPFYQNYLYYEYKDYRKRFVLRSYGRKPRYLLRSFHIDSRHYAEYVKDGRVKCLESQVKFVRNRGKCPYVVRYLFENKIETVEEKLDANWSPAVHGTAFIVPLFEGAQPLGVLIFWSRRQHRQYVNKPRFYLGPEKRIVGSSNDLRYFRSLQPLIAGEYHKLKADEERRRRIIDLENIMGALKEVILIEEKGKVLDQLAEFTAKSLNAEGCFIHLADPDKSQLALHASSGFDNISELKKLVNFPLQRLNAHHTDLPVQIFENQNEIIANGSREFRRLCGNQKKFGPIFSQLKSERVISYLGRSIGDLGVIEVFNKSKLTPSGWSFFEEQDSITLRHITDAIATVLNRMEATATQVQSEKVKVTSELLLDISHELKNPLYSSLIFVRKLKESLTGHAALGADNGASQTLTLIERNIEKAQKILRGMQGFQTILKQVNLEPVDLEKVIRMVIQTNQTFCEHQRIAVETDFIVQQPLVNGNELQLNQVFTNLVTNAIDAMPDGGKLLVRLREVNGSLHAEIQDTGSGIPPAIQDRVFEPFVTTKNFDKGTGLGLALSQRIIAQHNGKINFETREGLGTKFMVALPKYLGLTAS
jgi:signal transduction histidine kinase